MKRPRINPKFWGKEESISEAQFNLAWALKYGSFLYQRYNQFPPGYVARISQNRLIPPVVVDLGELAGLIYRSDKWHPGIPRTYVHFMDTPPRLVCNIEGTQVYIVGGNYRVTSRGIEG